MAESVTRGRLLGFRPSVEAVEQLDDMMGKTGETMQDLLDRIVGKFLAEAGARPVTARKPRGARPADTGLFE